jgi:creatinine amidohydrolase
MRQPIIALILTLSTPMSQIPSAPATEKGHRLENLSWVEAERILTRDAIVVLPVGAASKEHGPHLKLRNDLTIAEYLTRRVLEAAPVVVAPTLTYHHYPQFLEYPGSTSLTLATARDLTSEVVRSLTRYGPRRFYVLNTGISTIRPLEAAASALEREGVLVRYTDLRVRLDQASQAVRQQAAGSHADEVETSMMLYIDPSAVDMSKAVRDLSPSSPAIGLTRQRGGKGTYSPTGTWGDPTLATREKGRIIVEALIAGILADIQAMHSAALPTAVVEPSPPPPSPAPAPSTPASQEPSERCSAGDERTIRVCDLLGECRRAADRLVVVEGRRPDAPRRHGRTRFGRHCSESRAALSASRVPRHASSSYDRQHPMPGQRHRRCRREVGAARPDGLEREDAADHGRILHTGREAYQRVAD